MSFALAAFVNALALLDGAPRLPVFTGPEYVAPSPSLFWVVGVLSTVALLISLSMVAYCAARRDRRWRGYARLAAFSFFFAAASFGCLRLLETSNCFGRVGSVC